jgi:aryl-alcohol dehydrogenase-like predicted oxidoreductase
MTRPCCLLRLFAACRFVASVIIGATSLEQLKENIAAFELNLDEETLAAVDALHLKHRNPNVTD